MKDKLYVLLRCRFNGDSEVSPEFAGVFTSIDAIPSDIKNCVRKNDQGNFEKGFFTDDNLDKAPQSYEGEPDSPGFYIFKSIVLNTIEYN
jgi:hypothetical protein